VYVDRSKSTPRHLLLAQIAPAFLPNTERVYRGFGPLNPEAGLRLRCWRGSMRICAVLHEGCAGAFRGHLEADLLLRGPGKEFRVIFFDFEWYYQSYKRISPALPFQNANARVGISCRGNSCYRNPCNHASCHFGSSVLCSPYLLDRSVSTATSATVEVQRLELLAPTLAGARALRSFILECYGSRLAFSA
jgi:hypothetical protein